MTHPFLNGNTNNIALFKSSNGGQPGIIRKNDPGLPSLGTKTIPDRPSTKKKMMPAFGWSFFGVECGIRIASGIVSIGFSNVNWWIFVRDPCPTHFFPLLALNAYFGRSNARSSFFYDPRLPSPGRVIDIFDEKNARSIFFIKKCQSYAYFLKKKKCQKYFFV